MSLVPQEITDVELAFPTAVKGKLPDYSEVPEEFKKNDNPWVKLFEKMFYEGLQDPKFYGKDGINPEKAYRHIRYVMGSWEPKHEHKTAGVAYLMSLWFQKVEHYHEGAVRVVE